VSVKGNSWGYRKKKKKKKIKKKTKKKKLLERGLATIEKKTKESSAQRISKDTQGTATTA